MKLKVACIQTDATDCFERNLKRARQFADRCVERGVRLIAFPEMFLFRGGPEKFRAVAEKSAAALQAFKEFARAREVAVLFGSVLESSRFRHRFFSTSYFISPRGMITAVYRKIHLFDVKTPGRTKVQESREIVPGASLVSVDCFGIRFGFSICYDLRFPELFRKLAARGAQVIFVPSNFLKETGKVHWHLLLKARAVENQVFVLAPNQAGKNRVIGLVSYGHSLILGPWGEVMAEGSEKGSGMIEASLDFDYLKKIRKNFPVLKHIRLSI